MKRVFFLIILAVALPTLLFANERKHLIKIYELNKKDASETVDFVILKWSYRFVTTDSYREQRITTIEMSFYKNGNNVPVEKIILEDGIEGGDRLYFEKVVFVNREKTQQKYAAFYTYTDKSVIIRIFEDDDGLTLGTQVVELIAEK